MVFEGVLVSVLNRFLGPYVKNLDSSQLKVAIWSGEVHLQGLEVKENALTQFEIPLRVLKGHLGKLRLSIPWKNLYTDPVVIEIDGVYIIAGPETAVRYDPLKEQKEEKEKKQRKLKQIEEARKKAELDLKTSDQDPGFVEKLITQIVRNVQLTVSNIHIRYEDNVTNPKAPFAFGITLDSLLLQSTNGKWEIKDNITPEDTTSSIIHKLVKLDSLALYWNCGTQFIGGLDEWKEKLKQGITDQDETSPKMDYVLSPLSASAKLTMTTRPGEDINIPQLSADLIVYKVSVSIEKQQYQDILALIDSVDRMMVGRKYRKYRPSVSLSNNASIWWKYAYNAVLEEDVKRRLYMWSWKRMKEHRLLCKQYTKYYTEKLVSNSVPAYVVAKIEDIEDELDIFNITVCRQLAENMAQKQLKLKQQQEQESSWFGWTTGWIRGGDKEDPIENIPSDDDIEAEKDKLYDAIGYSQKGKVAGYPKEYVAHKIQFNLRQVSFKFLDAILSIGQLITDNVLLSVMHRPAVQNISVKTSVQQLTLTGSVKEGPPPCIITSDIGSKVNEEALLSVEFDLNPLNSIYDQRLRLKLLPVKVTYDGATVDHMISMFLPPPSIKLQKISSGVSSTIESLKTQTRAGLEHAISQRKLMDVDIFLCSPVIYIPEGGVMSDDVRVVCVDLGSLRFISNMKHNIPDVRGATSEQLEELFYDHFKLCIKDVNLTIGVEHLVDPIQLDIEIHKSLLPNDTRLPGLKVNGKLPCVSVNLSDKKVKDVIKLVQSLPFPPPALTNREQLAENYTHIDIPVDLGTNDILNVAVSMDKDESEESDDEFITASEGEDCEVVQERKPIIESTTKVAIDFSLPAVIIHFSEDRNEMEDLTFDMKLSKLMVCIQVASWDTTVHASIDSLMIQDCYNTEVPFSLLGCNEAEQFVKVSIVQANRDAPHYKSAYHMTRTGITASMSAMNINLRQDTVCHILEITRDIISNIQSKDHEEVLLAVEAQPSKQDKGCDTVPGEIYMNISVNLSGIHLTLSNSELGEFLNSGVHQVTSSIIKTHGKTNIHASVKSVSVKNPLVDREDQRKCLLSEVVNSVGSRAVDVKIVKYEDSTDEITATIEINSKLGRLKMAFSVDLIINLLDFLKALQISQDTARNTASVAVSKVQERGKNVKHIKLNVEIDAPEILLISPSSSVLVIYLGYLVLSNSFSERELVLFQDYEIQLSSVQMYRSYVTSDGTLSDEKVYILQPCGIVVVIQKNATSQKCKDIPFVDVSVKFTPVKLHISVCDTETIADIVNYNLKQILSTNQKNEHQERGNQKKEDVTLVDEYVLLKVQAELNEFSLVIGDAKTDGSHDDSTGIASIVVYKTTFNALINSTSAINSSASVGGISIDEISKNNASRFTRVLTQKSSGPEALISVELNQNALKDKEVCVSIAYPEVSLNIPFIMALIKNLKDLVAPLSSLGTTTNDMSDEVQTQTSPESQINSGSEFVLTISVINPRVLLLDIRDDIQADALILQTNVSVKLRRIQGQQNMFASLSDLSIMSSTLTSNYACDKSCLVLSPCNISMSYSNPEGTKKDLTLNVGIISITLSPSTVRLLLNITQEFNVVEKEQLVGETAPLDLWMTKTVDYSKWYTHPPIKKESLIEKLQTAIEEETDIGVKGEHLYIDLQQVCVLIQRESPNTGNVSNLLSLILGSYKSQAIKLYAEEWTGNLKAEASISLTVSAYNNYSDTWEAILEPLPKAILEPLPKAILEPTVKQVGETAYRSWNLQAKLEKFDSTICDDNEMLPELSMEISSADALQITLSKTSINSILQLLQSYQKQSEAHLFGKEENLEGMAIIFNNQLGSSYLVELTPKLHFVSTTRVKLSFESTSVLMREKYDHSILPGEIIPPSEKKQPVVSVCVSGYKSFDFVITSSGRRYYPLKHEKDKQVFGIVIEVDKISANEPTTVTLRSPLQLQSHLSIPMKVYWSHDESQDMLPLSCLEANDTMFLPLDIAHTGHLYFQPEMKSAQVSTHGISWKLPDKGINILCSPLFLHMKPEVENYHDKLPFSLSTRPHHKIHIYCPVVIHNHLPYNVRITNREIILPGGEMYLFECDPSKTYEADITISDDMSSYKGKILISYEKEEFASLELHSEHHNEIHLVVKKSLKGTLHIFIYSTCIIVNKTGFHLEYSNKHFWGGRKTFEHPISRRYILFPFDEVSVRVINKDESKTEWSDKFSLSTIGSEGVFSCKDGHRELKMGVKVRLSKFSLTKIITVSPFYMMYNKTKDIISVLEYGQSINDVINLVPDQMISFWPVESDLLTVDISYDNSSTFSMPFKYTRNRNLFLKLASEIPGISIHVQVTGSANLITFNPYYEGAVPVLIVNIMEYSVVYRQSGKEEPDESMPIHVLYSGESQMYSWDSHIASPHIMWAISHTNDIQYNKLKLKDGHGNVTIPPELRSDKGDSTTHHVSGSSIKRGVQGATGLVKKAVSRHENQGKKNDDQCYWVSFTDGFQRVLLFTCDSELAQHARNGSEHERATIDVSLSLKAVGLSLVNDRKGLEVSYIGLPQSEVIWEEHRKGKHWKPVELLLGNTLDQLYIQGANEVVEIPGSDLSVDFTNRKKIMLVSTSGKRKLRRNYFDGFCAEVSLSQNLTSVSLKISKLQIDNQIPFSVNPTIFYCYPPPPSIASSVVPKPFIEGSMILRNNDGAGSNEIQFCQVLIQEMGFVLDIEFLLELASLVEPLNTKPTDIELLTEDLQYIDMSLKTSEAEEVTRQAKKLNLKYIHLSPIDVHVSFSLDLSEEKKEEMLFYADRNWLVKAIVDVLQIFVGLIGQTKDAELKLGFFEVQERALTQHALTGQIIKHYEQQFLFQLYSVVLGLDVLGNPVAFLRDFTEGTIGLFYHPIQGAVIGPEEFFEGLALGTHQFIGGTFGGIAGLGARVTGVFGDVVAKLTFDKEFQEQRQRQHASFGQALETFSKGVFHGVTGVVAQPVKGAQKEGFLGFLRGTGKGILGLVLRPTGGLIDLTSATLFAVQKKTKVGDFELTQLRTPRYIGSDKIVYPFSSDISAGYAVYLSFENGKLYGIETYIGYLELSKDPLKALLVTDSRFTIVKLGGTLVSKWEDDMSIKFDVVCEPAVVRDDVITVQISESWFGLGFVGGKGKNVKTVKKLNMIPHECVGKGLMLINSGYECYVKKQELTF